jgi:hypothetical protein
MAKNTVVTTKKVVWCVCEQCGHNWRPRKKDVRICPNPRCHSLRWDQPEEEPEKSPRARDAKYPKVCSVNIF